MVEELTKKHESVDKSQANGGANDSGNKFRDEIYAPRNSAPPAGTDANTSATGKESIRDSAKSLSRLPELDLESRGKEARQKGAQEKNIDSSIAKGDKLSLAETKKLLDAKADKDGIEKLPTGDHIVREDGKETLFTPNGDRVSVNPDGTSTVKGDLKKILSDRDGSSTVYFADGAIVSYDANGIRSVSRDGQGIGFARPAQFMKSMSSCKL
ncbi:MAG: hypothetical protein K2X27_21505 [Candidatus Obscuribacterales bacterium]|nr:hypothetical protein [Candidatus Obscuribacterales bacterium]